jgi:probable HAF family extracellular repeat protein
MKDLGTFGGSSSYGRDINNLGQVVGQSDMPDGIRHAFLYTDGRMLDLNSLISPVDGWTLGYACGISDNGYITGYGTIGSGSTMHAFLLTPVPEPTTLMLLACGMIAMRKRMRN